MSERRIPNSLTPSPRLPRVETGVYGLDHILHGGLPADRATLVVGGSGSGKTLLVCEIVQRAVADRGESAVFITFEESADDLSRNVATLGWDFQKLEADDRLRMVDASPKYEAEADMEAGEFDLSGILVQANHAAEEIGASLIVLDGLSGLFQQFSDIAAVRRGLYRIVTRLKVAGRRVLLTGERIPGSRTLSRFGVEDYVADAVIVLRQTLADEHVRRTVQIHKLRGDSHAQGAYPFAITNQGLYIIALSEVDLRQDSEVDRLNFGSKAFDGMTGGGVFRDSIVLIAGPTGSGKTLLSTTFANGGFKQGERVMYFGFEESEQQLRRNAHSWGMDFPTAEDNGLLRVVCRYPESAGLEGHMISLREAVEDFEPKRIVIDSISALERIANVRLFREFVIGLTGYLKEKQICAVLTSTSSNLSGGDSVTEQHISTITDSIVLLRYVESEGNVRRGMVVIKMRGSQHEKQLREFTVSDAGLTVLEPFADLDCNVLIGT